MLVDEENNRQILYKGYFVNNVLVDWIQDKKIVAKEWVIHDEES